MFGVTVPTPPDDPKVAHLRSELDRFKEANQKLVRQLNAERQRNSDLENQVGRLERELIQVKAPNAQAHLQEMLDDLQRP